MQGVVYIGENVKRVRTVRALTQVELAEKAKITPATLVRIERNQAEPHMSTVRKLAAALNVDPSELVKSD
jgi:transcriptional regulator with XRE-family HTH domain